MVKLTGINKYVKKTEAQRARIRGGATEYVRQAARAVLRELVLNTPQWSGDLASSWRIDLNYMPAEWEGDSRLKVDPWQDLQNPSFKGDMEAWKVALEANMPRLKAIRWNAKVRIVNDNPVADYLAGLPPKEANETLRQGNYLTGDVMAILHTSAKFKLGNNALGLSIKGTLNYDT